MDGTLRSGISTVKRYCLHWECLKGLFRIQNAFYWAVGGLLKTLNCKILNSNILGADYK